MSEYLSDESLLERLIELSTFGLDDLLENRQGRLSGLQRSRLAIMTVLSFCASSVAYLSAACALWLFFKQPQSVPFFGCFVWVGFCGFAGTDWLRRSLPMWEDFREANVLRITGPVKLIYTRTGSKAPTYEVSYRIAKRVFDMAYLAPRLFPEDQVCHAYYTPRSEIIVGIEPVVPKHGGPT